MKTEEMDNVWIGLDSFQLVIDIARKHDLPAPESINDNGIYVKSAADVLAWGAALGAVPRVYDGSGPGRFDIVQAHVDLPNLGVGEYFNVLGSSACGLAGTDHDHSRCVRTTALKASAHR